MMIAVITPEHDNGVIRVRTFPESVEDAPHHGIRIAHAGKVAMDGIVHRIQVLQFPEDS